MGSLLLLASDTRIGAEGPDGVNLLGDGLRDALDPQQGLYTLVELGAAPRARVIGAIRELLVGSSDAPVVTPNTIIDTEEQADLNTLMVRIQNVAEGVEGLTKMSSESSDSIGRAPGPDSPPTMSQSKRFVSGQIFTGPRSGSHERKRTWAGTARNSSTVTSSIEQLGKMPWAFARMSGRPSARSSATRTVTSTRS